MFEIIFIQIMTADLTLVQGMRTLPNLPACISDARVAINFVERSPTRAPTSIIACRRFDPGERQTPFHQADPDTVDQRDWWFSRTITRGPQMKG